ncbi:MAG: DUF4358 domain-containing protein [Oscillospiraceae bacterium]|nr:DUF4358 domain-containing protein [Oscillospiraceae bacterium]
MKHIRLISLGTAVVLSLSLLTACGGDKAPVSGSVSDPDVSISTPDVSAPDVSTEIPPVDLPQVIRSLALNKTDFTLKTAGASYKLVADVFGVEDPVIVWTSSDEAVATVDENGVVTAVAAGTATITAALEGTDMTVDCTVRCNIKTEEQPADPAPEVNPEEPPVEPAPEVKPEAPAKVDLAAFYNGIFTDPDNSPAMLPMDNDALDAFYPGLNAIALKQKVAYMPMMTAVPCEIVLVECANAADVAAVKAIFNARIAAQVDNHFNYPMVIEAWEREAKVVANGNFVALLVVSGMTDTVVSDFNALF